MKSVESGLREFRLPDVGEGLTEAEILTWRVQVGDRVTDGQFVVEVETAKAAVELPIPFDGVVHELRYPVGATVDVGSVIVVIAAGGAGASGTAEPAEEPEPPARQPVLVGYGVAEGSGGRRKRTNAPYPTRSMAPAQSAGSAPGVRPLAKPPVRKLARDLGIDLASVTPSGVGGIVTADDVRAAAVPEVRTVPENPRERRVPIKGVRKATAQVVSRSAFTAPHVTEFATFDITETVESVAALKQDPAFAGVRVSPLLLVARALLVAIRRNPGANARWDEAAQEIVTYDYVNLGIAAATPRGLIVPNIKDADRLTFRDLATALADLVGEARAGTTTPAALRGGTITITNIGVFGVDTGTPILNQGEAAILAFGAIRDMPWVVDGKVVPRKVTTLSLSFDHRLVDGELGSRLLADTAALLEHPRRFLTWT
ncbi:2-oxo acid dehydrogenase subunit E2 [Actinokineospora enzanensis]|uniref:dihydrolipoamide acetyltransferase family protein n=1 Tax=Actinokineospora enzanensis TaxID=155975 RepID=UPI00036E5C2A